VLRELEVAFICDCIVQVQMLSAKALINPPLSGRRRVSGRTAALPVRSVRRPHHARVSGRRSVEVPRTTAMLVSHVGHQQ